MPYLLPTSDIYSIYLNNSRLTLRTALWRSAIRCDPGLTLSNSSLLFLGGNFSWVFLCTKGSAAQEPPVLVVERLVLE